MSMASATSSSVPEQAPSMRLRIAVSLAALALVVILVQSLWLLSLLDDKEEHFIEGQLNAQIEYSMAVWQESPGAAFPNTPAMWLYRVDKKQNNGGVPPTFSSLPVGMHEIYLGSKEYYVAVREDENARYILAYDIADHESRLTSLIWLTFAGSLLLGLLTLIAGYLLAGRLTRRLDRLALKFEGDAPESFCEPGMERELKAVAEALDHYRKRQAVALERERAFGANLSHELRTPLTGIRTDAELIAALPDLPEIVARRGNRIISNVDRINATANSLLLLARETKPGGLEEICLRPALATVWEAVLLALPKPVSLRLDVSPEAMVMADPTLLDLVLRNVLDNALRYSEAGEVHCWLEGSRLLVRDQGPGFVEADFERAFDLFFIGPRGTNGLGLALVRHICQASGWQVSAANAPGGGALIAIDFAASLTISSQIAH